MPFVRTFLSRLAEERLLLVLLFALAALLLLAPQGPAALNELIDWRTIAALAGLLVLSRGLEDSGSLARAGHSLLSRVQSERALAAALVLFAALLAMLVTNDVALFIVVPLTLGLGRVVPSLPVGRLVIFEAFAVNAGSTLSPVGNPQNLFLWQSSGAGLAEFALTMLSLAGALMLLLLALLPFAFRARPLAIADISSHMPLDRKLAALSLALYAPFLIAVELGHAAWAAIAIITLYLGVARKVLRGVDWPLLLIFVLMFVDLGLLAGLPAIATQLPALFSLPGGLLSAGALLSQGISNVPATIFLASFSDDWRTLAWAAAVGGFGTAIGSLANLIALRLSRQPGLWREFHLWSLPLLVCAWALAAWLL